MRAIGVRTFGGADHLEVLDLPEPHAGPGQVRIRVAAATVNPTDLALVAGAYAETMTGDGPWVPGAEAAGVVDEVGDGAPLRVGDPVLALTVPYSPTGGAYADHVVVPAAQVAAIPAGIDPVHAATLPMNGLTALLTLELLAVPAGGSIAVTGATGAYGGYVAQLAHHTGLRVVVDARDADADLVRSLGADVVVPRSDDLPAAVRAAVPAGVDGLADGAALSERAVGAVRDGGAMVSVRRWTGPAPRGIRVSALLVYDHADRRDGLLRLVELAAAGAVTLRVADVLPPERAGEAHRRLAAGGLRGRLVLDLR